MVVEVHPCLCASSLSVDALVCHFGQEGSRLFDFHEPWQGVFLSQPSPCYPQETKQSASSLLGHRRKLS
jgi:hypothetical protein